MSEPWFPSEADRKAIAEVLSGGTMYESLINIDGMVDKMVDQLAGQVNGSIEQIVYDLAAEIDIEDIDSILAPLRAQVPDSVLWRHDKVILETYIEARAAAGINPRGLTWPGLAFEWDTPEDEEVDAA